MKVVFSLEADTLKVLPLLIAQAGAEIVAETLDEIETDLKVNMAAPKTGLQYPRGARWHQASAPGEAPAIDYGNLVNSIQKEQDGARGLIYSNSEYAAPLEYGSPARGLAPRPAWIPAAERARKGFESKWADLESKLGA